MSYSNNYASNGANRNEMGAGSNTKQEQMSSTSSSTTSRRMKFSGLHKGHSTGSFAKNSNHGQSQPSTTGGSGSKGVQKSKVTEKRSDMLKALAKQTPKLKSNSSQTASLSQTQPTNTATYASNTLSKSSSSLTPNFSIQSSSNHQKKSSQHDDHHTTNQMTPTTNTMVQAHAQVQEGKKKTSSSSSSSSPKKSPKKKKNKEEKASEPVAVTSSGSVKEQKEHNNAFTSTSTVDTTKNITTVNSPSPPPSRRSKRKSKRKRPREEGEDKATSATRWTIETPERQKLQKKESPVKKDSLNEIPQENEGNFPSTPSAYEDEDVPPTTSPKSRRKRNRRKRSTKGEGNTLAMEGTTKTYTRSVPEHEAATSLEKATTPKKSADKKTNAQNSSRFLQSSSNSTLFQGTSSENELRASKSTKTMRSTRQDQQTPLPHDGNTTEQSACQPMEKPAAAGSQSRTDNIHYAKNNEEARLANENDTKKKKKKASGYHLTGDFDVGRTTSQASAAKVSPKKKKRKTENNMCSIISSADATEIRSAAPSTTKYSMEESKPEPGSQPDRLAHNSTVAITGEGVKSNTAMEPSSLDSFMSAYPISLHRKCADSIKDEANELWSSCTVCGQLFSWAMCAVSRVSASTNRMNSPSKKSLKRFKEIKDCVLMLKTIAEAERRLFGTQGVSTSNDNETKENGKQKKQVKFCTFDFTTVDSCPSDVGSEYWMKALVQYEKENKKDLKEYAILPCLAKPVKHEQESDQEIDASIDIDVPVRTPMEVLLEYLERISSLVLNTCRQKGQNARWFLAFHCALCEIADGRQKKDEDIQLLDSTTTTSCADTALRKAARQYANEFSGIKCVLAGEEENPYDAIPFKSQISACISSVMRFHLRRVFNPHAEYIIEEDENGQQDSDAVSDTSSTFSFTSSARGVGRGGGADVDGFISIDEECMTLKYNIDDLAAIVNRALSTVHAYKDAVQEYISQVNENDFSAEDVQKVVDDVPVPAIHEVLEYSQSALFLKQLFAHPAVKTAMQSECSSWERLRQVARYIKEMKCESEEYLLPFRNLDSFKDGLPSQEMLQQLLQCAEKTRKKYLRTLSRVKKEQRRRSRSLLSPSKSESSAGETSKTDNLSEHQRILLDNEDLLQLDSLFQYPSLVYVTASLSDEGETEQVFESPFESPVLDPDEKQIQQQPSSEDVVDVDNGTVAELTSQAFQSPQSQSSDQSISEPDQVVFSPNLTTFPPDDTPVKSQNPYWHL